MIAFSSMMLALDVERGLDQRLAVPRDSFLIPYFDNLAAFVRVGPPVYFVVSGVDLSVTEEQSKMCTRMKRCSNTSVPALLHAAQRAPSATRIALPPASWLDDFAAWLNPEFSRCCRESESGFCPSGPLSTSCATKRLNEDSNCRTCFNASAYQSLQIAPTGKAFYDYLDYFLDAEPSEACVLAGKAAYRSSVNVTKNGSMVSAVRTFHSVLRTQRDFIRAYESAVELARSMELHNHPLRVFPYSVFYVFFEQYRTIVFDTFAVLASVLLVVMALTWLFFGNWIYAVLVGVNVLLCTLTLFGSMGLLGIGLNALSLVNLIMGVGIYVEFCAHMIRAYTVSKEISRQDRTLDALVTIAGSVFSGITLTKFLGISILAFARSQIFVVYYFRMYVVVIFAGWFHGQILLPELLSLFGPEPKGHQSREGAVQIESENAATT